MSEALKTALISVEPNNNRQFMYIVRTVMQELNLTKKDIAHMFTVSIPTVERWMSGENAPHPAMRSCLYRTLLSLVCRGS